MGGGYEKLTDIFGIFSFIMLFAAAGAAAATHNIYVAAPGVSVHNVIYYDGGLYEDAWNDGSGITSAYYSQSPTSLGWSDVSFQFNLAALAGSRVQSARINFKLDQTVSPDNDNTIPLATLNHYGGSQKPTGNAQNDKITGEQALQLSIGLIWGNHSK